MGVPAFLRYAEDRLQVILKVVLMSGLRYNGISIASIDADRLPRIKRLIKPAVSAPISKLATYIHAIASPAFPAEPGNKAASNKA